MIDLNKCIEEQRMKAFQTYVRDWLKQNPDTVERKGDIFSYRTKRGIVKTYKAYKDYEISARIGLLQLVE